MEGKIQRAQGLGIISLISQYTKIDVIHNMQKSYIFRRKRYQIKTSCLKDVLIILEFGEGTEETGANNVTCFISSFTI